MIPFEPQTPLSILTALQGFVDHREAVAELCGMSHVMGISLRMVLAGSNSLMLLVRFTFDYVRACLSGVGQIL